MLGNVYYPLLICHLETLPAGNPFHIINKRLVTQTPFLIDILLRFPLIFYP